MPTHHSISLHVQRYSIHSHAQFSGDCVGVAERGWGGRKRWILRDQYVNVVMVTVWKLQQNWKYCRLNKIIFFLSQNDLEGIDYRSKLLPSLPHPPLFPPPLSLSISLSPPSLLTLRVLVLDQVWQHFPFKGESILEMFCHIIQYPSAHYVHVTVKQVGVHLEMRRPAQKNCELFVPNIFKILL